MNKNVLNNNIYQYLSAISAGLCCLVFGVNTSWTSPYLLHLLSDDSVVPMTNEQSSWIAIAPLIGCGIGAVSISALPDRIGRKSSILVLSPVIFLCLLGIGFVRNVWYLFALRCILGMTDGATYTVLPMYVGEISDPAIRDTLNTVVCNFFIGGVILINVLGYFFSIFASSMICSVIPILQFITFVFMPESPYYYIKKNNIDAAEKSLARLKGTNNVSKDVELIREGINRYEHEEKTKAMDLITRESNRKGVYIFLVLILTNKFCGKTPLLMYTNLIFEVSGSSINSSFCSIIYNSVELIVVLITVWFIVNRVGKRILLIISTTGTIVTTMLFAVYFLLQDMGVEAIEYFAWSPLTLLIVYNIFYSVGLAFGPYTYLSELFPLNIKSKATCMGEVVTVVVGALTSKFFQSTYDISGTMAIPFFCFSTATCICLMFIVKVVPEINGKSLQEIQDIMNRTSKSKKVEQC